MISSAIIIINRMDGRTEGRTPLIFLISLIDLLTAPCVVRLGLMFTHRFESRV